MQVLRKSGAGGEINEFVLRYRAATELFSGIATRVRFNPSSNSTWFGGVMEIINNITMSQLGLLVILIIISFPWLVSSGGVSFLIDIEPE